MGWNRKCSDPPLWVRNGYTHAVVRCIIYPDTVGHVLLRLIPGDTIFCHSGVHRNMTCHEFGFCSLPTLLVPLLHRRFRAHRTHRRERAPCQDNTKSPFHLFHTLLPSIRPIYHVIFQELLSLLTYLNLITPSFICQ